MLRGAAGRRYLSYSPKRVSPQDILEGCISPLMLSSYAGWVLDRMAGSSAQAAARSGCAPASQAAPPAEESSAPACEEPSPPSRSETKVAATAARTETKSFLTAVKRLIRFGFCCVNLCVCLGGCFSSLWHNRGDAMGVKSSVL